MKYLVCVLTTLAAAAWCAVPARASVIVNTPRSLGLERGLVGWWTFDGKDMSNNYAFDKSGDGNRGTLTGTNGVPIRGVGKIGQAIEFDGVDDYVNVSGSTQYIQTSASFTVSAWVYLKQFDGTAYHHITTLRSNGTYPYELLFSNDTAGTGYLGFAMGSQDTFTPLRTNTPAADMVGKWIHAVLTYNGNGAGTAANYAAYMNNVPQTLVATGDFGGNKSQQTAIGGYASAPSSGEIWNGLIDDVRIYNRALSADEIKRLYNMGR